MDRDGQPVCGGAEAVGAGDLAAHEQDAGIADRPPHGLAPRGVGQEELAVGQLGEWVVGRQQANLAGAGGVAQFVEILDVRPGAPAVDGDRGELVVEPMPESGGRRPG